MSISRQAAELNTENMVSVIRRLTDILREELSLIRKMKLKTLHHNAEEKEKLISIVEEYKAVLSSNPMIIKSMPKQTLDRIKKANQEFEDLIEKNGDQLIKARKVHAIVMDAIKKALEKSSTKDSTYNSSGTIGENKKKTYVQPISINSNI